jgi:lyso-ornithine lipid O-acyltransferase
MQTLRATWTLTLFLALTLPLMPLQWLLLKFWPRAAVNLPHWYHRQVCALLGLRIHQSGHALADRPVLLVANHVSWLDIPVLSAVAPVSFVAKAQVGTWPLIGTLARLQRTVFVDRDARITTGQQTSEIARRLANEDRIVLFAEGTSSDGNRVLPFKSALLGAVMGMPAGGGPHMPAIQTIALAYTGLHGLPLGRGLRPEIAWYGDMDVPGHAWNLLKLGPIDVQVRIGPALEIANFADRKQLARHCEKTIRDDMRALLRPAKMP